MKKNIKIINIILFITYIFLLAYLTLFKNYLGREVGTYSINLIPFKNIIKITHEFLINNVSLRFFIRNIFGNLIAFTPFSYFFLTIFKIKNKKQFTIIMFFIILFIETLQLILKVGCLDIDDIILNLLGALILFTLLTNRFKKIIKY